MTCPMQSKENAEILLDYCSRSLPADTLARMDAHVAMCASCKQELTAQQQLWSALDEFDVAALSVTPDFDRRLYARIEAEHRDPVWVRAWRSLFASGQPGAWRPAYSMMAVAGVAVLALLLVRLPVQPMASPAVMAQEEIAEPAVKTATIDKQGDKQIDKQDVERLDTALEDLEMLHLLGSTSNSSGKSNAL